MFTEKSTSYVYTQVPIDVVLTYLYHVVFTVHKRVEDWKKSIVAFVYEFFKPTYGNIANFFMTTSLCYGKMPQST